MSDAPTSANTSDDEKMGRRERYLRLALITVGAALIATAFSIYSQRNDGDPVAASRATAEASSGVVTTDIAATVDGETSSTAVVTRFNGDDYESALTAVADSDASGGGVLSQEVRAVGGQLHYSSSEDEAWQGADDLGLVVLDAGVPVPAGIVGWSTADIDDFLDAVDIDEFDDDGSATGSTSVAEVRALDSIPPPIAALVDRRWGWADEQAIAIAVATGSDNSQLIALSLDATAEDENGDGTAVTVDVAYTELDADIAIEPPS